MGSNLLSARTRDPFPLAQATRGTRPFSASDAEQRINDEESYDTRAGLELHQLPVVIPLLQFCNGQSFGLPC